MLRGLEGRRIAVFVSGADEAHSAPIIQVLEKAGARLHILKSGAISEEDWHGARYAALVLIADESVKDAKVVQLARELFVSEKPVAAFGDGAVELARAGGVEEACTARHGDSVDEFASRIVREFTDRLEEHQVDEMSDLSFPASDPPVVTPTNVGRVTPDTDARP